MTKILLVEDNEMNRDMLSRRLQRRNFEVVVAADGEQAIYMVEQEAPDVVLMDMDLPIIDGWTASQKIKSNQNTSSIPIIALTAHVMADDLEKALAAGCNDYETKPIEFQRLLSKIEKLTKTN